MNDPTQPIPTGKRAAPRGATPTTIAGDAAREEQITVLDPTPAATLAGIDPSIARTGGVSVAGAPGQLHVMKPSSDVVGSAVDRPVIAVDKMAKARALADELGVPLEAILKTLPAGSVEPPEPVEIHVTYYRYTGEKERKFTMPQGDGRTGYSATIRPGKVLSDKDYPLASLKAQGFLPGRNLEEISAEEAKAA